MGVDCAEVLEPLVIDHLDAVYYLHVVCNFVLEHSRVFDDRVRVYVVLMALLLVQTAVIVVTAKVVKLVYVEGVAFISHYLVHPLFILVFWKRFSVD